MDEEELAGLPEIARSVVFTEADGPNGATEVRGEIRLRATYVLAEGHHSLHALRMARHYIRRKLLAELYRDRYREMGELLRRLLMMTPMDREWNEVRGRLMRLAEHACEPWPFENEGEKEKEKERLDAVLKLAATMAEQDARLGAGFYGHADWATPYAALCRLGEDHVGRWVCATCGTENATAQAECGCCKLERPQAVAGEKVEGWGAAPASGKSKLQLKDRKDPNHPLYGMGED